jgi:hypothetical protein
MASPILPSQPQFLILLRFGIFKMGHNEMNEWYDAMDVELANLPARDTMIEILQSEVL